MIRYEKTIWENDKTPVNSQHLGKVEDGLEYLFDVIKDVPAGEDSRIANEKQRQVNETTRQNNEIKRNDTLNAKVEEVDNAIAASNNNIKEVNNKFETIVASKQQDAEVILARGKYPSLPTRLDNLDKDLLNVKDTAVIPVTTESNFVTVEETVNGYLTDFKLEGRTFVNIYNATLKADEELQLKMSQNTIKNFSNTVTVIGVNKPISIGIFKNDVWVRDINIPSLPHLLELNEGEYVDTIVGLKSKGWTSNDFNDFKKIFVVSGDCIKTPPRFFEGMKSVGDDVEEIVVASVKGDGNLIDASELEINKSINPQGELSSDPGRVATGYIRVQENTKYYFKGTNYYPNAPTRSYYCFYDINKKLIGDRDFFDNYVFTTPKGCAYVRLFTHSVSEVIGTPLSNLENIKYVLYKGTSELENVHKSDKKKVLYYDIGTQSWKKPVLREWDSIEEHGDSKCYYHKRSITKVLNGSESGIEMYDQGTDLQFNIPINTPPKSKISCICDKFKTLEEMTEEGIQTNPVGGGLIVIRISKTRLEAATLEGFKKWLQSNNVTVVYQLAEEKVHECMPIDLIAFENETNYMIECGSITPKSSFKYEGCVGNVINTLKEKVSYLEDKLYKTNLANFTVALNALDTKLKLEQLTKTPK